MSGMMMLTLLILPVLVSVAYWYVVATPWFCSGLCCLTKKACTPVRTLGSVKSSSFESIKEAFEESLTRGWDLGASLYVALNGESVVDLVGGYQDRARKHAYEKDTMSLIFSSGKVLENIAVAIAVDNGILELNDPISKYYWPEFAAAGKKDITIGDILQHRSGVATLFEATPHVDTLKDAGKRDAFLASQKPYFPRGTVAYRGWGSAMYTDAVLRRVDPTQRSLANFVQEELMDRVGGKLTCPPVKLSDQGLSMVHDASLLTIMLGVLPQTFFPGILGSLLGKNHTLAMGEAETRILKSFISKDRPAFAQPSIPDVDKGAASWNNESSFLAYPMLSSNCFSNARSIGQAVDAFFQGKVVSTKTFELFTSPLPSAFDQFFLSNVTYTVGGFGVGGNAVLPIPEHWDCMGWAGLGGSLIQHCKVGGKAFTFAYVPNGLSPRLVTERGLSLLEKTFEAVQNL